MKTYVLIRVYADGQDGGVLGYAKRYVDGSWVFAPAVSTSRRATGKRYRSMEACLPKWTGGLDATRTELCD